MRTPWRDSGANQFVFRWYPYSVYTRFPSYKRIFGIFNQTGELYEIQQQDVIVIAVNGGHAVVFATVGSVHYRSEQTTVASAVAAVACTIINKLKVDCSRRKVSIWSKS